MRLKRPILLFTDLDDTLLDHYDYSWRAADQALATLKAQRVPVIINTSKTLEESVVVWRELALDTPVIFENGAGIALPVEQWPEPDIDWQREGDFWVKSCTLGYGDVRVMLQGLRREWGFKFTGFGDMDIDQVQHHTGLDRHSAARALRRRFCEPLVWQDTEKRRDEFMVLVQAWGFTQTRGGRFLHVMGAADKGSAMEWLAQRSTPKHQRVALGDGQNDLPMLRRADVGVLVRSAAHDLPHFPVAQQPKCFIVTEECGSAGWNRAVLDILKELHGG